MDVNVVVGVVMRYIIGLAFLGVVAVITARQYLRKRRGRVGRHRAHSIGTTRLLASGVFKQTSWQEMDAIINILVVFESGDAMPSRQSVIDALGAHITPHVRFHSVPYQSSPGGEITWLSRPVDFDRHVIENDIPDCPRGLVHAKERIARVRSFAQDIVRTSLKSRIDDRPWWECHRIKCGTEGGALLFRIHHICGDGVSMFQAFLPLLTDRKTGGAVGSAAFAPRRAHSRSSRLKKIWQIVSGRWVIDFFNFARAATHVLLLPHKNPDSVCCVNPTVRHTQPMSPNVRWIVYFPTHSLDLIKRIKDQISKQRPRPHGSESITVNDVEFALFAGALRRLLIQRGEDPCQIQLTALTPFAAPQPIDPQSLYNATLRNYWTFVSNRIPIDSSTARQRVEKSHASWCRIKKGPLVFASFVLHRLASRLPLSFQKTVNDELMRRHAFIFSNVPGPTGDVRALGSAVSTMHIIYPNYAQQVSIVSMAGYLYGCAVMALSPSDADRFQSDFSTAFVDELSELAKDVLGYSLSETLTFVRL